MDHERHETAEVSPEATIGAGTKIWHYVHVREGARVGKDCNIGRGVYIDAGVVVGNGCKIQNYACLYKGLRVGNGVFIGPHACFTNDKHPDAKFWSDELIQPTVVESGVSIGANATIVCGVTIGRGAVIGAGAVVTKDVPAGETWVGNPAQVLVPKKGLLK